MHWRSIRQACQKNISARASTGISASAPEVWIANETSSAHKPGARLQAGAQPTSRCAFNALGVNLLLVGPLGSEVRHEDHARPDASRHDDIAQDAGRRLLQAHPWSGTIRAHDLERCPGGGSRLLNVTRDVSPGADRVAVAVDLLPKL